MPDPIYQERHAPTVDVDEILRLNREWWEANLTLDVPRMEKVFPSPGEEYLMFNFNGHTYYNMREKVALWEFYKQVIPQSMGLDVRIMRLDVHGDLAWLACEVELHDETVEGEEWTADDVESPWCRATEIYRRDNGTGGSEWRMWHTHISPMPDLDTPRPGFDDTTNSRGGLGWVPWNPLPTKDR